MKIIFNFRDELSKKNSVELPSNVAVAYKGAVREKVAQIFKRSITLVLLGVLYLTIITGINPIFVGDAWGWITSAVMIIMGFALAKAITRDEPRAILIFTAINTLEFSQILDEFINNVEKTLWKSRMLLLPLPRKRLKILEGDLGSAIILKDICEACAEITDLSEATQIIELNMEDLYGFIVKKNG